MVMMMGIHHTATVYKRNANHNYCLARTGAGDTVLVHNQARRVPQLIIDTSWRYREQAGFDHCLVKVPAPRPPAVGTEIWFLPRVGARGYAAKCWLEVDDWMATEVYNLSVRAHKVYYKHGVESGVELLFWGKLGRFVHEYPLDSMLRRDPFLPWERGYQSSLGEFSCLLNGEMIPCPDPRYLAS